MREGFAIHSYLTSAISKGSGGCQLCSWTSSPTYLLKKCLAGDSQPLDVCSVHQTSSPLRYSVSLLGYGFYGDVLAESEKHRWMGPLRYDFSGTDCWVKQSLWLCWNVTGDICPGHLFYSDNHSLVFRHNGVSLQQELCRHSSVYPSGPSALQSKRQNSLPLRVKHQKLWHKSYVRGDSFFLMTK